MTAPVGRSTWKAARVGVPNRDQLEALRIAPAYLEVWFKRNRISWRAIQDAKPVWHTTEGAVALTLADVEDLIAVEDPVVWAWLNLVEKKTLTIDGVIVVRRGDPWNLFPIQAELARCEGDLVVECGAEVGKTRDIVLRRLWIADTNPGSTAMIGGDSDQTLMPIWEEIEFQVEQNPGIGGGLVEEKCHIKPNRKKVWRNGSEIELRLAGHDGKNFRGGHFSAGIDADESAKWKNPQQWSEFFRAGLPGSIARIYSTPDGDYSSPFYGFCARAIPVGSTTPASGANGTLTDDGTVRHLRKFHISKRQLPPPFWTPTRAAALSAQFGGEDSIGWITNVEGAWGSPSYSVFPMSGLEPCLQFLEDYRLVVATVDRAERKVLFAASRIDPGQELEGPGATTERILTRDTIPLVVETHKGRDLGRRIAGFFPAAAREWVTPVLVWGADVGSVEATELLCVRVAGKKWRDVFRVHLRRADWEELAAITVQLDHASGHCARWSIDSGSAGAALVLALTERDENKTCPECPANANELHLAERVVGRRFDQKVVEVDLETGQPMFNPDSVDEAGNPVPVRLTNKEFSTRILERKIPPGDLEIARDGGCGDQRNASAQLLVNHTAAGVNRAGERNFRGVDDHSIDARRQAALEIVDAERASGFVSPTVESLGRVGTTRSGARLFDAGTVATDFGRDRLDLGFYD